MNSAQRRKDRRRHQYLLKQLDRVYKQVLESDSFVENLNSSFWKRLKFLFNPKVKELRKILLKGNKSYCND